jgi:hypothetical protein
LNDHVTTEGSTDITDDLQLLFRRYVDLAIPSVMQEFRVKVQARIRDGCPVWFPVGLDPESNTARIQGPAIAPTRHRTIAENLELFDQSAGVHEVKDYGANNRARDNCKRCDS